MQSSREPISSLLRPRYRSLLRVRRRKSYLFRTGKNLSLIVSFAVCLCAAAYMESMVNDLLTDTQYGFDSVHHISGVPRTFAKGNCKTRLPISLFKAILENRGVSTHNLIERYEFETAVQLTGQLTVEEFKLAQNAVILDNNFNASSHPDALIYEEVRGQQISFKDHSSQQPTSIVFDSESEFIERVDDNKDSVWLLVVVAKTQEHLRHTSEASTRWSVSGETWATLTYRYSPFGFKMGILNCNRLQSICLDRGLIAVDLVLALPRGGDRIKDSVQFRPFLLRKPQARSASAQSPISDSHRQSAIVNLIHEWLTSVLSERVRPIRSVEDILPISSVLISQPGVTSYRMRSHLSNWLTRSPQPIHFIWLRQHHSYDLDYFNSIPLVLSALSVPYTGRIRFWTLDANKSFENINNHITSSEHRSVSTHSILSPIDLIRELACPSNATYLLVTPEGYCFPYAAVSKQRRGEYLNFSMLELYLRFLYPSVDDLLLLLALLVNLSVLLSSAITAGKLVLAAYLSLQHNDNVAASAIGSTTSNNTLGTPPRQLVPTDPAVSRLRMVETLVDFARRGWTAYTPAGVRQRVSTEQQPVAPLIRSNEGYSIQLSRRSVILSLLRRWLETLLLDAFYANLIILLTILPVINILSLSYSCFMINVFFWLFRFLSTSSLATTLRLSISSTVFTWYALMTFTILFWCLVVAVSACYPLLYARHMTFVTHSRRRRRLPNSAIMYGFNSSSPETFWADLTRLLLMSDMENRTGYNSSTASTSSSDLDSPLTSHQMPASVYQYLDTESPTSSPGQQATVNVPASFDQLEQTRLLRRLDRLHQMLGQRGDSGNSTPLTAAANRLIGAVSDATPEEPSVSSAHIYTWRCICNVPRRVDPLLATSGAEEIQNSSTDGKPPRLEVVTCLSDNDSDLHSHVNRIKPSASHRRSTRTTPSTMCHQPPTYSFGSSCEGDCDEAEDELDQSSDSHHIPVIKVKCFYRTRALRLRGRRLHSSRHLVYTQPSSDSSSQEEDVTQHADSENGQSDDQFSTTVSLTSSSQPFATFFPNWPTWVIACPSCVVCRRTFRNGVRLGALPCGHAFHEACIRRWLDTGALDCPLCRWPAYAPHLRQQREMISQLITTVKSTLTGNGNRLT